MYKILIAFISTFPFISPAAFSQAFSGNKSVTYDECIAAYKTLDEKYDNAKLIECGLTDIGKPLHLFVITNDGDFNPQSIHENNKSVLLINNGIHPGEPTGVDACIELSEDLLSDAAMKKLTTNLAICIIPVYNIDGALNRGNYSRANQNGPDEYGFRANARNLDLNRDMIKCDAQNSKSLIEIFQKWKPEVFIDTHISNGADYPYIMTLIATQQNKVHEKISAYMNTKMNPYLYSEMKKQKYEMCPYIEPVGESPESGLGGFLDLPRYTTGYAALFNTISYVTETHMLKPYEQQVKSTYVFLKTAITYINEHAAEINDVKKQADASACIMNNFPVQFKPDTTKCDTVLFNGYEAKHKKSNVTGGERLYYDKQSPYKKKLAYYNYYLPTVVVQKPYCYLIPKQWHQTAELLKLNGVSLIQFSKDTIIEVEATYITNYKSTQKPYEGHYLHSDVETRTEQQKILFFKGDFVVMCNQPSNYFISTVLEPKSADSYFAWNFYDSVLQQKEWFSDYVFEEIAEKLLKDDEEFQEEFAEYVSEHKIENDRWAQLAWIYHHSPYYEITHNRYPLFRLNSTINLPVK